MVKLSTFSLVSVVNVQTNYKWAMGLKDEQIRASRKQCSSMVMQLTQSYQVISSYLNKLVVFVIITSYCVRLCFNYFHIFTLHC